MQGLAEHKDELGAPLCPCRHYDDKQMEAQQGFWNCPCVPMRERKVCLSYCTLNGATVAHALHTAHAQLFLFCSHSNSHICV